MKVFVLDPIGQAGQDVLTSNNLDLFVVYRKRRHSRPENLRLVLWAIPAEAPSRILVTRYAGTLIDLSCRIGHPRCSMWASNSARNVCRNPVMG